MSEFKVGDAVRLESGERMIVSHIHYQYLCKWYEAGEPFEHTFDAQDLELVPEEEICQDLT